MDGQSRDASQDDSDILTSLLADEGVEWPAVSRIPLRHRRDDHRPSFAQQRLWTLHQLYPGARAAYNVVLPVQLSGALDSRALERSLNDVIDRHEVLRSSVISQLGQPLVRARPSAAVRVPVIDLRELTEPARRNAVARFIDEESQHVFALEQAPLIRLTLLQTSDAEHTAVLNLHHLVADAWSMDVLIRELSQSYRAHLTGRVDPLPDLPIQYGDFAEWQRAQWEDGRLTAQLDYWTRQLSGAAYLELPAGRSALRKTSFAGAVRSITVPPTLTSALRQRGQQSGATLFMTVFAAFTALLYRYTAQSDILVGTPVANRTRRETEPLIGFFVNTLVLRSRVTGEMSFRSLLEQVRDTAVAAYAAQDVPFEQIVHELTPDRDAGLSPLFHVMFSLDTGTSPELNLPGVRVTPLPVATTSSKFDLTLALTETEQGLTGGFEYSTEVFDADAVAGMAEHFERLVAGAIEAPDRPISLLPLLSPREKRLAVVEWNRTARPYPADASIVDVFESQVAKSFDAVALEFGDRILTYGELNDSADRFARRLRLAGIREDDRVGVCMSPTAEMVIGLLGILKAGGVYVPLNPADPPARIRAIVVEARMRVVVTERHLASVLPADLVEAIPIVADQPDDIDASRNRTPRRIDGANLAYIIYTSGSTGDPKGIAIPHRAVLRLVLNSDYVQCDPSDRVAQASTFTFDAITFELWGPLLNGACLVGVERDVVLSPTRLARFLADERITTLFLTTALFNGIAQVAPDAFAPLRHLLFGGEAVDPERVADVLDAGPPKRLLHVYGPTETTTFATWFLVEHVMRGAKTVPIGRPIANTETYVLDGSLGPVPIGVPGELYLGGDGLARGYWAQPALTADKFRPHPFDDRPGSRLYRTGDWVRRLPSGDIEFLGRIDHQVKIRGFRVELGDIEAALLRHRDVRQAVVRSHQQPGHHRLIAYVVARAGASCDSADVLAHLRELLPNYMIPAQIVHLDQFPLTPGGKIDRRSLPTPDLPIATGHAYEAPRSAAEQLLAQVWKDVLGAPIVGVTDNYLELGGDSITAIQIASRVRRGGWELDPGDVIRSPTIASLAPGLRPLTEHNGARAVVTGPVPLTPIQRWFFDAHSGDRHHFNQSVLLTARQRLETDALRAALHALQEQHDALRITYAVAADVAQRNQGLDHPIALEEVDLREGAGQEAQMESHAALLQAGLNLEQGPLMKAAVYHCDEGDRLLLVVHHLVVDLMSWRILLEDLETAYQQRRRGEEVDLGAKSDSYQLWAEEIERFATSPEHLQEIDYWVHRPDDPALTLSGAPPAADSARETPNLFGSSAVADITLDERATRDLLIGVHHAYNTEVNDVMLTALGRALRRWSGESRHWVTLEGHGRERLTRPLNLARTVGWFTSLFPFLLDLRGDDPGTQLCEVKEALRRVPRKGIGYGVLRYITPPEHRRGLQFGAAPAISFNYAGQFDGGEKGSCFELAGQSVGSPVSPSLARQHAIDVSSMVVGGRLQVAIVFDRERYTAERIDRLLADYVTELTALAGHCRRRAVAEKTPSDFVASAFSLDEYRRFLEKHQWTAAEIDDIYPLSPMQDGLLFQHLYDSTSDAYFIQTVCRVEGPLDPEAFRESWHELSRRHAALRTAFVHDDDLPRPLQVVLEERAPTVVTLDIRGMPAAEQSAFVSDCEARDRQRRFDLQRDALMRVTVIRLSDTTSHLIWAYPHIVLDGWCVGIIYTELLQIYEALCRGGRPALPPAPRYRDYFLWLQSTDQEAARGYWRTRLDGYAHAVTPSRGAVAGRAPVGEWKIRTLDLSSDLSRRVRHVAGELTVTLNTIVQTAWGLVLSRYNDTRDVVFGTIVSGRPPELPGVEDTVGVFINAVPVHIRFARDESVAQLLQRVQQAALESERAQYLPLAEILAESACGRGLFDHLLVFENYPVGREPLRATDSAIRNLFVRFLASQDRTHYDFDLVIVPGERIQIQIGYTTASYDDRQIEQTAAHLERAISGIVQHPELSIDRVDILPQWERHAVVHGFNATPQTLPDDRTLIDLFDEQVQRAPDAVAVSSHDRSLSYCDLSQQIDRLASRLVERGVGPEILVAISGERSLQAVVGMLAVLKAGGAYLPLDSAAPPERLAFIVADAKPSLLLTEPGTSTELIPSARTIHFEPGHTGEPATSRAAASRAHPDGLAYVIYTSGTTGWPKGVMVAQRSLLNGARAWNAYYGLDTFPVRMLQMAPFSSDVFTGDVVRCLTSGGTLTICPPDARADPSSLYELMAAHQISIFESTPALIVPLMEYIYDSGLDTSFLKILIIGSDTLPVAQYNTLLERFGHAMRIVNSYGVTEATIESSCFELDSQWRVRGGDGEETPRWSGPTPIGKPLHNLRYLVRDREGRPMPIGFAGELHIGGAGVARGYLGCAALTAERFIPDPVDRGERLYKSGDVVRWLPDGNLEFLGRNDHQVKIRGYRIELSEIEYWLLQHPFVRRAAVRLVDYGDNDKELAAYVVYDDGDGRESGAVRAALRDAVLRFLAAKLPAYMVPRHLVELPALPLTAHGKVDYAALPPPEDGRAHVSPRDGRGDGLAETGASVLPTSEPERTLLGIWEEVLRIRSTSADDNFFELGGHSLKAMQIVSRVHKHLGTRISYRDFFEHPTLAGLCGLVTAARPGGDSLSNWVPADRVESASAVAAPASAGAADYSSIARRPPAADHALSHAQQRLWLLHELEGRIAYNMPEAFLLEDDLDLAAVDRAFATLVERHEALRTAFVRVDGVPRQKILETVALSVRTVDVSDNPDPEARARELAGAEAAEPFDLTAPPLLRPVVFRLAPRRYVFLLVIHHIIGDGWSMNVLYREMLALYTAYREGRPNPLSPLRIQYADYADWQHQRDFTADQQYWLDVLAGAPDRLRLPYDYPQRTTRDFAGHIEERRLSAADTARLRTVAASHHTTLSTVVLAIFQMILYRWTGEPDVCVGLSIANRNHPDSENLIGFFVNLLPIRVQLSHDMEAADLLAQVAARTTEAFEHQDYPFDRLIEALKPQRAGSRQPLVNVIYAFQNFQDVTIDIGLPQAARASAEVNAAVDTPAPAIRPFPIPFETSKFDLTLFVTDEGERLLLTLEYDTGLFRADTIRRCLGWIERVAGDFA